MTTAALVQFHGIYSLCHQGNHEEFFTGEPFIENSQGDGRNLPGCVMGPDEVADYPVNVQCPLQS